MDKFIQRLVAGSILLLLLTIVIFFSHTPFFQLVFVLFSATTTYLALQEFYHLTEQQGYHPLTILGGFFTFLYAFAIYFSTQFTTPSPLISTLPLFVLYGFFISAFLYFFIQGKQPIINLAITFFGFIYLTIPLTCAIQINYWHFKTPLLDGRMVLTYTLLVAKFNDIGAYFIGKSFGKHALAPYISPKKTIEGAIGGWIFALLISLCFSFYLPFTLIQNLLFATLISVVAQLGDLAESLLKRDAKIKDSGKIPGLGGILDVVDSLVFSLPIMYLLLKLELI
jgi:phosphatidate cytidylyltransferase